jgi:hypothetical protein
MATFGSQDILPASGVWVIECICIVSICIRRICVFNSVSSLQRIGRDEGSEGRDGFKVNACARQAACTARSGTSRALVPKRLVLLRPCNISEFGIVHHSPFPFFNRSQNFEGEVASPGNLHAIPTIATGTCAGFEVEGMMPE